MGHGHHDDHEHPRTRRRRDGRGERPLRIGIGGPVGSGKTALVGALCRAAARRALAGRRHQRHLHHRGRRGPAARGRAADERIVAVETGCCPHTAIRDDISANLDAVETLEAALGDVDLTLVESGGDNLTAIFSRGLVDVQIFVIDVAGGDKVPRKGGPGVTTADLLVINKTDLAPLVGADLDLMLADATAPAQRAGAADVARSADGAAAVADWVRNVVARGGAGAA